MTIEQAKAVIQSSTLPAKIKEQALGNLEKCPIINDLPISVGNAIRSFRWVLDDITAWEWAGIAIRADRGEFDPTAEITGSSFPFMDERGSSSQWLGEDLPLTEPESVQEISKNLYKSIFIAAIKSVPENYLSKDNKPILNQMMIGEVINQLATLIHANRSLEKRIQSLENKKP